MTITYDNLADAKYIRLASGKVIRTEKKKPWLLFDYDRNKDVLGIEVLSASDHPITILASGGKLVSYWLDNSHTKLFQNGHTASISRNLFELSKAYG